MKPWVSAATRADIHVAPSRHDHRNSVHENRGTCRTFLMAGAKCPMRDLINYNRIYKAHRTIVWGTMKVFRLHCRNRHNVALSQQNHWYRHALSQHNHLGRHISDNKIRFFPMFIISIMCMTVQLGVSKTYKSENIGALKSSLLSKLHIFPCMDKIFCVEFQKVSPYKISYPYTERYFNTMLNIYGLPDLQACMRVSFKCPQNLFFVCVFLFYLYPAAEGRKLGHPLQLSNNAREEAGNAL